MSIEGRNASVNGDTSLPHALKDVHHAGPRFGAGCDEREKGLLGGGANTEQSSVLACGFSMLSWSASLMGVVSPSTEVVLSNSLGS